MNKFREALNEPRTYRVTIHEDFHNVTLTGEFIADNEDEATEKAQILYAIELDCDPDDIKIVEVEEI